MAARLPYVHAVHGCPRGDDSEGIPAGNHAWLRWWCTSTSYIDLHQRLSSIINTAVVVHGATGDDAHAGVLHCIIATDQGYSLVTLALALALAYTRTKYVPKVGKVGR